MENDEELTAVMEADPAGLSYEQARDGLLKVVHQLEEGNPTLEQSMQLWEKGEELASRCQKFLDDAQARLDQAKDSQSESE